MKIDTRPTIADRAYKGVQLLGNDTIHAIQTETVWRRLAHCGTALTAAVPGSLKPVNCPECLRQLRLAGYAG